MSAFNNKIHIKEENGVVTNIEEIDATLESFKDYFGDEEYRYIESLINFLLNSNIKNKYPLITVLNKYRYSDKLNSNKEACEYLNTVLGLNINMVTFKEDGKDRYYLYYYENENLKVLECMQKYDLANFVNTYQDTFKDKSKIIMNYIDYLKNTLNFDPEPKEIDINSYSDKEKVLSYLNKKNIKNFKIYIDSHNKVFIVAATAIISYDENGELHFLKSEDIFENKLDQSRYEYEDIPILLPFEVDVERLNNILDNLDNISSYDKRYLDASIKTIIEKPDNLDIECNDILNRYVEILNQKILNNTFILTKTEKEILARSQVKVDEIKKDLKFVTNGGYIIIMMEILIITLFVVMYISLAK